MLKRQFLYINLNYTDYRQQKKTCKYIYIYAKWENCETFNIQKSRHFSKSRNISVTFLYTKIQTLYVT